MSKIFKAWIPNVSGRLSFRVIGDSIHPTRCVTSNGAINKQGKVVASQTRLLDDSLVPGKWLREQVFPESVFHFVLIGEWKQQTSKYDASEMTGCIAAIPKIQWKAYEESVSLAIVQWDGFIKEKNESNTNLIQNLKEKLKAADYFCDFTLARDGELTLFLKRLPEIEYVEPEIEWKKREHELAGEFYFFLRDIAHSHRHHSPHSDKILDVKRVDKCDDYVWIASVFAALRRHAIGINRSSNSRNLSDHNGFLAYAEAFKAICDKKTSAHSKHLPQFTDILFQPMKSSLDARSLAEETQFNRSSNRVNIVMTAIVSFLAILLAALALLQLQPNRFAYTEIDPLFVCGGKSVLKNASFYTLFSFGILILSLLWVKGKLRASYQYLSDWSLRLIHSKDKFKAALISITFAIIFLITSYLVFLGLSTFDFDWQEFQICHKVELDTTKDLKKELIEQTSRIKNRNNSTYDYTLKNK